MSLSSGECLLIVPRDLPPVGAPRRIACAARVASDLARLVPGRTLMVVQSVTALVEARSALAGRDPLAWYQGMLPCDGERAGFESHPRGFLMVLPTWLGENPIEDLDVTCLVLERLPLGGRLEDTSDCDQDWAHPGMFGGEPEVEPLEALLPQAVDTVRRLAEELASTYPPRATVLAVMDERIVDRPWGRLFLQGLPGLALGRDLEDVASYYCRVASMGAVGGAP